MGIIKRFVRRRIIRPIFILIIIIAPIVSFGKGGFSFTGGPSKDDFSNVLKDGQINGSARVVDIAMLGAHDAFSHQISSSSEVDPGEDENSLLRKSALKVLTDGVFVRLSKAQKSGAAALLKGGVRYFDVRLSYHQDDWYTKHGLISNKLTTYLEEILVFLDSHPDEFIVFDIQHIYFANQNMDDLFSYLASYKVANKSLLDYVNFDPTTISLSQLTYDDVTNSQTQAGVVILANANNSITLAHHYNRGNGDSAIINIRSVWHNTANKGKLLEAIQEEVTYLNEATLYNNIFRVNQAQRTGVLSGSEIFDTIIGWSLLDMANKSNSDLVAHEDFASWLEVLPILMVDYANSAKGNFNKVANQTMIAFNQDL